MGAYLSSLFCHGGDLVGIFRTENRRQNRSQNTLKQARSNTVSVTEFYYLHSFGKPQRSRIVSIES